MVRVCCALQPIVIWAAVHAHMPDAHQAILCAQDAPLGGRKQVRVQLAATLIRSQSALQLEWTLYSNLKQPCPLRAVCDEGGRLLAETTPTVQC